MHYIASLIFVGEKSRIKGKIKSYEFDNPFQCQTSLFPMCPVAEVEETMTKFSFLCEISVKS